MKYFFIFALLLAVSLPGRGDNRRLVEAHCRELQEINRQILDQLKDFPQYRGKEVYLKVRVVDKGKGRLKAVIEKIAVDKIAVTPQDRTAKVIYLKGKVAATADNSKFKLDLEHVLPEAEDNDKNNPDKKEQTP
ncbi:MAG: hypothetical protein PHQ27_06760 [Victivallales bacterium]|nr:hypothetical protein [Victivallales bacterium]